MGFEENRSVGVCEYCKVNYTQRVKWQKFCGFKCLDRARDLEREKLPKSKRKKQQLCDVDRFAKDARDLGFSYGEYVASRDEIKLK